MKFLPMKMKPITYSGRGSSDFSVALLFPFIGACGIQADPPLECRYRIFVSSSALIYLYRDYGRLQQWTMFRAGSSLLLPVTGSFFNLFHETISNKPSFNLLLRMEGVGFHVYCVLV
jgi:hypothetical protein